MPDLSCMSVKMCSMDHARPFRKFLPVSNEHVKIFQDVFVSKWLTVSTARAYTARAQACQDLSRCVQSMDHARPVTGLDPGG